MNEPTNYLTTTLSEREKLALEDELEKLFALQDRPLSKEKKTILIEEMALMSLPFRALVSGIRQLMTEDLKSIKLWNIRDAAEKFVFAEAKPATECDFCEKTGAVVMFARQGEYLRRSAFACTCENGKSFAAMHGAAQWDGQDVQVCRKKNNHADLLTFYRRREHVPDSN